MRFFQSAWRWFMDNPVAIVGMLGAVVGAFFMWKRSSNKISSLEDAVAVAATKRKIAKNEARADLLESQAAGLNPKAENISREIADSKRRILEIEEGQRLDQLNDHEVAKRFTSAGF